MFISTEQSMEKHEEESTPETESEKEESPKKEDQIWRRKKRATSRAKQMKLRNLIQEKERLQQPQQKLSTSYANAAFS